MSEWLRGLLGFMRRNLRWWIAPPLALFAVLVIIAGLTAARRPRVAPETKTIDVIRRLHRHEGTFENTVRPTLSTTWLPIHPNGADRPPAQVVLPVTLPARSCFSSSLILNSGQGDGVIFEVEVRDASGATVVARELVTPARPNQRVAGISLERWQGRSVDLILRVLPGTDSSYDWSYFVGPRVGPCR